MWRMPKMFWTKAKFTKTRKNCSSKWEIKPLKIDICQNKIGFKSNLNRHKSTVKIEGYIAQFTEDNPNIGDNMFKFSSSSSDSNSSKIKKEGLDYVGGVPMGFLMSFFS